MDTLGKYDKINHSNLHLFIAAKQRTVANRAVMSLTLDNNNYSIVFRLYPDDLKELIRWMYAAWKEIK